LKAKFFIKITPLKALFIYASGAQRAAASSSEQQRAAASSSEQQRAVASSEATKQRSHSQPATSQRAGRLGHITLQSGICSFRTKE
jgi:hypothetical protein